MPNQQTADQSSISQLCRVIAKLNHPNEVQNFLYDVATPQEVVTLAQRFEIAKLLWTTPLSYQKIAQQTGASTTTVTRVARFLNQESFGGYRSVLSKFYPKKKAI